MTEPANIPTVEELRRKAETTRAEADRFTQADLRAYMIAIAEEYERLAKRAEDAEERVRVGASNEASLVKWYN